jgi:undecaprenyl-diphosphatase
MGKDILSGELSLESENILAMGAGFVAAFIAGLAACTWMIQIVKKSKLSYFAIYCLLVGFIAIGYSFWS